MSSHPSRGAGRPPAVRVDSYLVRTYRERAGMSREDLAELVGATARTLQRAENEGVVGLSLLRQVCQVLRLPVTAVLRRDTESIRAQLRGAGLAPPAATTELIGREVELQRLEATLSSTQGPRIAVIDGPLGCGKTALAQRLAHDLGDSFPDGIVWLRCDFTDLRAAQAEVAHALGLDFELRADGPASSGRDWSQMFAAHFWRGRRLLVLDDLQDSAHVKPFVDDEARATVLVTTRFQHVADEVATLRVSLAPLGDAEVTEILAHGGSSAQLECDPSTRARILELIGGMPDLAHHVRATLRRERFSTLASWLKRFERDNDLTSSSGTGVFGDESALARYARLERSLSADAWRLFAALGLFDTGAAPLALATAAAGIDPGLAEHAASELVDIQLARVEEHPAGASLDLRLSPHAALAARALLGDRAREARLRVTAHLGVSGEPSGA